MVAGSVTTEDVYQADARRMWNAVVKDGHNLTPKFLPQIISSVTFIEGDGLAVGSVKLVKLTPAVKGFTHLKERMDEIDEENMVYKYTMIEGGWVGGILSSLNFELKFAPTEEGGCVVTKISNYEILPNAPIDEGTIQAELKKNSNPAFKEIEQYILSNPNLYC